MIMQLIRMFWNPTKWEVLEAYSYGLTWYCVQVRMNRATGFKHFRVRRITGQFHNANISITKEMIDKATA